MILSLFWKEYREHRSVWLAMALLAVISLTVAAQVLLPQGLRAAAEDYTGSVVGGGPRAFYTLTDMTSHDIKIGMRWLLQPEAPVPLMRRG